MSLPTSFNSYPIEQELFERAMASPKGIRKRCETEGKARHLVARLNNLRALDRRQNALVMEDHAKAFSDWDVIRCSAARDAAGVWWAILEKLIIADSELVEDL